MLYDLTMLILLDLFFFFFLPIFICTAVFLISAVPAPCVVQRVHGLIKPGSYSVHPTVAPLST